MDYWEVRMEQEIKNSIAQYYRFWFGLNYWYEKWAKSKGMTSHMLFILYTVRSMEQSCTQRKICEALMLPKQTVSALLSALERSGCVVRSNDPTDHRNKLIRLTESGAEYAEQILEKLYQIERQAMVQLDAGERQSFVQGCDRFLTAFERSVRQTLQEERGFHQPFEQ